MYPFMQYAEAKKHIVHLLARLQKYQEMVTRSKRDNNTTTKEPIPHESDSVEFRKTVVSTYALNVQMTYYHGVSSGERNGDGGKSSSNLVSVLDVVSNKWMVWVKHLAAKDAEEARPNFETMFRQLYNYATRKHQEEGRGSSDRGGRKDRAEEAGRRENEGDPILTRTFECALECLHTRRDVFFDCACRIAAHFYDKVYGTFVCGLNSLLFE